jgi:transposase-like protein
LWLFSPLNARGEEAMTCHSCKAACKRFGRHRNGLQRFRCNQCNKTYTEEHERPLDAMRIPLDRALNVLQLLLEGSKRSKFPSGAFLTEV